MNRTTLGIGFTDALPWRNSSIIPASPQIDETANLARERLRANPYSEVRALQCEHHECVLVLRGRVPSYYHKQLAQEAVRNVKGVEMILNSVEVISREASLEY